MTVAYIRIREHLGITIRQQLLGGTMLTTALYYMLAILYRLHALITARYRTVQAEKESRCHIVGLKMTRINSKLPKVSLVAIADSVY